MVELLRLRVHCKKCKSLRAWYCLLCRITYCYECDMINEHRNQIHGGNCVIFTIISGSLRTMTKDSGSEEHNVYFDQFMDEWNTSKRNTPDFKLSQSKYSSAIEKWLKSN